MTGRELNGREQEAQGHPGGRQEQDVEEVYHDVSRVFVRLM
jgi:hypothetical protein